MNKNPKLSIIIPVYNEGKNIKKVIDSLNKQSYKNFEIIIVDDGSTDNSLKYPKQFNNITVLEQKHQGPGAARNLGAKNAKGQILIFVDADMTFDKDYLKHLINPIVQGKTFGTEEELQLAKNAKYNIWSKCQGELVTNPNKKQRKIFRAILKTKFQELGGFDPKYGHADDQTFFIKHGITSTIAKNAICYHDNPSTLSEVFKQSRWIGSSNLPKFLQTPVLNVLALIILTFISPLTILVLGLRKSYKLRDFQILIPWMLVFMTARYFGTLSGYKRKIFHGINYR